MSTPSIRTLAAIAYERGEEFDPALMLSPSPAQQAEELRTRDTENQDAFVAKMGISREGLRELEMCPFLDELVRLDHEPAAVIEAEYLAEQARRNKDVATAGEAGS
jgi:hypothetical protein